MNINEQTLSRNLKEVCIIKVLMYTCTHGSLVVEHWSRETNSDVGSNPTWGSSLFFLKKGESEPSQVLLCCLALLLCLNYLIMYPLSLEIGVIGGLITLAFSYVLS